MMSTLSDLLIRQKSLAMLIIRIVLVETARRTGVNLGKQRVTIEKLHFALLECNISTDN